MTRSSDSAPGFDTGRAYRNVFIVDSRDWFEGCRAHYDAHVDLVLTYDFGLRRQIALVGGAVRLTTGSALVRTVTLTGADVREAPALSVATAVSV